MVDTNNKNPEYTCRVCGEKFKDGWDHVLVNLPGVPGLVPKDKPHADLMKEIENSRWTKPCFCGGHISTYGHGDPDGGASWETTCDDCQFLWDED